jgi:hypothetical protein
MPKLNTQELKELGFTKTEKKYLRQFIREYNLGDITSSRTSSTWPVATEFGINATLYFDDNGNNYIEVESKNFPHSQSLDGVFLYTPRDTKITVNLHCEDLHSYEHLVLFIRSKNNQLTKNEIEYNRSAK